MQEYTVTSLLHTYEVDTISKIDLLAISSNPENPTHAIRILCIPSESQAKTLLGSSIRVNNLTLAEANDGTAIKCIKMTRLETVPLTALPKLTVDNLINKE